jgi:hypothetical protein
VQHAETRQTLNPRTCGGNREHGAAERGPDAVVGRRLPFQNHNPKFDIVGSAMARGTRVDVQIILNMVESDPGGLHDVGDFLRQARITRSRTLHSEQLLGEAVEAMHRFRA